MILWTVIFKLFNIKQSTADFIPSDKKFLGDFQILDHLPLWNELSRVMVPSLFSWRPSVRSLYNVSDTHSVHLLVEGGSTPLLHFYFKYNYYNKKNCLILIFSFSVGNDSLFDNKSEDQAFNDNKSFENALIYEPNVMESIRDTRRRWFALALILFMILAASSVLTARTRSAIWSSVKWHTTLTQHTHPSTTSCTRSSTTPTSCCRSSVTSWSTESACTSPSWSSRCCWR